jgi:tetratricopeptide (TPR) repeat protein
MVQLQKEANVPGPPPDFDDQDVVQVLLKLGQCLSAAGRNQQSLAAYAQALKKRPTSLAALVGRGREHLRLNDYDKAIADFNAAVEHWPTSPEPLLERALLQQSLGRGDAAAQDRRAAESIDRRVVAIATGRHAAPSLTSVG